MSFRAAIQPLGIDLSVTNKNRVYASAESQKNLAKVISSRIKQEKGDSYLGELRGKRIADFDIDRNNFLGDIQEYAASIDECSIEAIYMGNEQTRFNHLVEIRNNIGIYLPTFFFFPMHITDKQNAMPIYVGSSVKLHAELKELNRKLKAEDEVDLGDIQSQYTATEEDLEDYEALHEGVSNFWPKFSYILLEKLAKRSIEHKLPLFIYY